MPGPRRGVAQHSAVRLCPFFGPISRMITCIIILIRLRFWTMRHWDACASSISRRRLGAILPRQRPARGAGRRERTADRAFLRRLRVVRVRKFAAGPGLDRGYSAHSMRATLENGAQLEDVQKAAGHRDPGTTKLYDRRGYNPEKAASFFATC
jgi:integrase